MAPSREAWHEHRRPKSACLVAYRHQICSTHSRRDLPRAWPQCGCDPRAHPQPAVDHVCASWGNFAETRHAHAYTRARRRLWLWSAVEMIMSRWRAGGSAVSLGGGGGATVAVRSRALRSDDSPPSIAWPAAEFVRPTTFSEGASVEQGSPQPQSAPAGPRAAKATSAAACGGRHACAAAAGV